MQDTRLFSTKLTFPWGLSYFSPSPQSKGRFYEITDVGLANMLNLIWKYVEKEKKKENPVFFNALFHLLLQSWTCVKLVPISYRGGGGGGGGRGAGGVLNGWGGGGGEGGCRDGGEFWNVEVWGWGASSTQPYAYPYSNFPKCPWAVRWQKQTSSQ